jgi:hypothetical protein
MNEKNIYLKNLRQNEYLAFYRYFHWENDGYSSPEVYNYCLIVNSEGKIVTRFIDDDWYRTLPDVILPNGEKLKSRGLSLDYDGFYERIGEKVYIIKQPQTLLHKAMTIVSNAFSDVFGAKKDKAGKPYIFHLLYVMGKGQNEQEKIVGVLHDSIEDCSDESCLRNYGTETYADLILKEFGQEIFDAVKCLTKIKGEDYDIYLKKVKDNELARQVKLYDLEHNMDIGRLPNPKQEDYDRLEKYKKSYNYLKF